MEEKRLIQACLNGDSRAQHQLFERYAQPMMGVCMRYAKGKEEAEDMLQEAFIRIFKNLGQFAFKGSFEGWVRRIVVNTAIKYYYRHDKHSGHADIELVREEHYDARIIERMAAAEILKLITELPEGYRIIFNMYAIDGYSHKEIAETLGIEESTSRSQLVKARRALQQKIKHMEKIAV